MGTGTTPDIDVYPQLEVEAEVIGSCTSSLGYRATVTGGTPAGVRYEWTFSGPGPVTPPSSTDPDGIATVTVGGRYDANVVVTDLRTDGPTCTERPDPASGHAWLPLSVNLRLEESALTCSTGLTTDEVTYVPVSSGGNGDYSYTWNGYSCSGASCTMDPLDSSLCVGPLSFNVTLRDSSGLCSPAASESETYGKSTTVTATDN
jgi:hypothetical protein